MTGDDVSDPPAEVAALRAELARTQDLLASRLSAVGELAAAVAHDLNNFSNVALMAASLARDGATDTLTALLRIERANRAIGDLARRLQRVARTGPDPQSEGADLHQIVDDVAHLVAPLCDKGQIALETRIAEEAPAIVAADGTLVRQTVMSILLNAREASLTLPPERRRITIDVATSGDQVALSVRDGRRDVAAGTIDILKPMGRLGGVVDVRSEPDGGARFTLTFARAAGRPSKRRSFSFVESTSRLRVLVVDDQPDFSETLHGLLHDLGHDVTSSMSAQEALSACGRTKFDVVLCDVGLPEQSGLDVAGLIAEGAPATKLVLMTGWDTDTVKTDPRVSRCHGILQKPFEASDLTRLLATLFPDRSESA